MCMVDPFDEAYENQCNRITRGPEELLLIRVIGSEPGCLAIQGLITCACRSFCAHGAMRLHGAKEPLTDSERLMRVSVVLSGRR